MSEGIQGLSLTLLAGIPGAGKSTYAGRFPPASVISPDFCRWLIGDDEDAQSVSEDADELALHLLELRLRNGRSAVADGGTLDPARRHKLRQLARRYGAAAHLVLLDTPFWQACHNSWYRDRQIMPHVVYRCLEAFGTLCRTAPGESWDSITTVQWDEKKGGPATVASPPATLPRAISTV
ncbi:MAG: AAA family ATPase [Chloroflexota bacterium]